MTADEMYADMVSARMSAAYYFACIVEDGGSAASWVIGEWDNNPWLADYTSTNVVNEIKRLRVKMTEEK